MSRRWACGGWWGVLLVGAACGTPVASTDAASVDAANVDAATLPACEVPAPIVAGTPETDALASAPARCGMPAYTWLRDPSLGSMVSRTRGQTFTHTQLTSLASAAGLALPRAITHDVAIDTVAYVTQDRGQLVESSAALAYPTDLAERASVPTLLMLHGTSGWRPRCGPTVDLNFHSIAALLAAYGFVVVGPDYLGLESTGTPYGAPPPYLVGEATAIASLDAVRAGLHALSDLRLPACGSSDVVVWGASQGGHAALWVDRLAPYYARELHLRGVVAAIPATDVVAHAEHAFTAPVDTTSFMAAMLATAPAWYGLEGRIGEIFVSPQDVALPAALAASCTPTITTDPLDGLLTASVRDAASAGTLGSLSPWGCLLSESSLLDSTIPRLSTASDPSYGILFITGSNDTILVPTIERPGYDQLCARGAPLTYLECQGAGHAEAALWSIGETLDFLDARVRGDAFTPACTRPAATRCMGTPATTP